MPEVNIKHEYYKEQDRKRKSAGYKKVKCRERNATETQKAKCRERKKLQSLQKQKIGQARDTLTKHLLVLKNIIRKSVTCKKDTKTKRLC